MIEEQREESELGITVFGCCATISCRMHAASLISLSSAESESVQNKTNSDCQAVEP